MYFLNLTVYLSNLHIYENLNGFVMYFKKIVLLIVLYLTVLETTGFKVEEF